MYQRKTIADSIDTRTVNFNPSSPRIDRNGHNNIGTPTSVRNSGRKLQPRLTPVRNHGKKQFDAKLPQLAILCLVVVLIGLLGFMGAWMAIGVNQEEGRNDEGSSHSFVRIRKEHVPNPVGKEIPKVEQIIVASKDSSPFRSVSEGAPECLELESPDDITVTLVSQVSHDRLWMMKHHCERYRNKKGGPFDQHKMSIAIYSNATLKEILDEFREMDCGVAAGDEKQKMRAPVDVSVLDARIHGAWNEFPVNELRNLALSKVTTTHILYIDVDFWPSDDLYETIMGSEGEDATNHGNKNGGGGDKQAITSNPSSLAIRQELFNDPKLALVIPAFQLWRQCPEWEDCRDNNFPHMESSRTFEGLIHEIVQQTVTIFDPTNRGGHGSTEYKTWFSQPPGSLFDIECLKSNRYEPFVMVRYCRDLPPFQTVFAGYGKNKVTWMMQIIASGYIFSQVGGAFLVHYPHLDSASRQSWNGGGGQRLPGTTTDVPAVNRTQTKRGKIDKLFVGFKEWLWETIPADTRRMETCVDAQDDDGKLWVEQTRVAPKR